jgi:hypothetical protein
MLDRMHLVLSLSLSLSLSYKKWNIHPCTHHLDLIEVNVSLSQEQTTMQKLLISFA